VGDQLAVTPHGLYLTLWDLETSTSVQTMLRQDASWRLYGMIDAHALVGGRNTVELWHLRQGTMRWSVSKADARAATVVGDAAVLAAPGRIVVRSVDGTIVRELPCSELAGGEDDWSLNVDRAATTAVISTGSDLLAIDLATGGVRSRFSSPGSYVEVAIAANDRDAIVWSYLTHIAAVWELTTGACRLRVASAHAPVTTPDGQTAIVSEGSRLRAYPVDGCDRSEASPAWIAIALTSAGIVALDRNYSVNVADRAGALRKVWKLPADCWPYALGGHRIAIRDGDGIAILDAATGARERTIPMRTKPSFLTLGDQAHMLAATTNDGAVRVWNLDDGTELPSFRTRDPSPDVLAIDGQRLAVRSDTTLELWRIGAEPLRLHTFRSLTEPRCAAFDASHRWLVSGQEDGALLVRDIQARAHHATLEAHTNAVRTVAIRGTRVAACAADGAVSLWDLERGERMGWWAGDVDVLDLVWLDDETLACASECGLLVLKTAAI
jgi:WD40 repeat protein